MKPTEQSWLEGTLPDRAPLANPFVPFQQEDAPQYEARTALVRGTLFPALDLPFHGMINKAEKPVTPMSELQTLAFAVQELALYLDTHRDDQQALEVYRRYQQMYDHCLSQYRKAHGPLSHQDPADTPDYAWLDDPWPWEYGHNQEV